MRSQEFFAMVATGNARMVTGQPQRIEVQIVRDQNFPTDDEIQKQKRMVLIANIICIFRIYLWSILFNLLLDCKKNRM